jgi:hypothetical protein
MTTAPTDNTPATDCISSAVSWAAIACRSSADGPAPLKTKPAGSSTRKHAGKEQGCTGEFLGEKKPKHTLSMCADRAGVDTWADGGNLGLVAGVGGHVREDEHGGDSAGGDTEDEGGEPLTGCGLATASRPGLIVHDPKEKRRRGVRGARKGEPLHASSTSSMGAHGDSANSVRAFASP